MITRMLDYETPSTGKRRVCMVNMIAASMLLVKGKENLEKLKVVDDIVDSEWEAGPSSANKRGFNTSWEND